MIECTPFYAFDGFDATVRGVMAALQQRMPMHLWLLSRVQGEQYIVLQTAEHLPVPNMEGIPAAGTVLPWKSVVCHQMVAGLGPIIAPDVSLVPSYRDCPVVSAYGIAAYVGIPLLKEDGALFGTLCGVSMAKMPHAICEHKSTLELFAQLLATLLSHEIRAEDAGREAERCRAEAMRDGPTGLFNRRAMQKLMDAEDARCRRYGHAASVIVIDLNGLKAVNDRQGHAAGDAMIRRAADTIKNAARDSDLVGRIGGDEFVVLAVECDEYNGEALAQRIRDDLAAAGLSAGLGSASREAGQTLYHAMDLADQRMYADKRRGKASIVPLEFDRAAV